MAKTYAVATEFSVVDRASRVLDRISGAGNRLSRALPKQMEAAELRFQAFGASAQKAVVGAFGAVAATTGAVLKQAIPLGMELEQNLGGTEAVFSKYASNVQKLAESAYKNMGLSASDYMATANKMGSLFQGSGVSQVRAMELTTQAMQRAADVASVMGIDTKFAMESIAGAAKGNFTMMDNLGVAMNATTLEAYALEKGMNFKWKTASNAEKAEVAMKMFFERTAQYAGNFAKESMSTLSGSFGMMKTSVQDLLANMALGRSIDVPLKNMQDSVIAFTRNIVPTIVNIINKLPAIIKGVMSQVSPIIEEAIHKIDSPFGPILVGGLKVIKMLWNMRYAIFAIGAVAIVWRIIMDGIFLATKAMQAFNIVMGFGKGLMIAYKAAAMGTAIAIKATGTASLAAAAGMKAYAIGAKIAAAAQAVFNAIMSMNPVALVVIAIVALIGLILVLTNKWKTVTDAVDGFFTRIRDMKGIAGIILNLLISPFELAWKVIRSVFDIFAAFKAGGFINGLKMIGLSVLQLLTAPFLIAFKTIRSIFGAFKAGNFLKEIKGIGSAIQNIFSGLKESWFLSEIREMGIKIVQFLISPFVRIKEAIQNVFSAFKNGGFLEGIKTLGATILDFLVSPFKHIWEIFQTIFSMFKSGSIISGLKKIGLSILEFLVSPLKGILDILSFLPMIGNILDRVSNWFETTRASLLAGGTTESEEEEDSAKNEVATAVPTRTAATATSYSREESFTTNRVEIGLDEGLSVKNGAMEAPAFTLFTGRK